jgi:hypothetical protein
VGKNRPHSVLFQNIKDRGNPIGLGAEFDMIPGILWNLSEEFV